MIKIIVSDLDETLVGPDGNVSEENIEAIKKATQKGLSLSLIPDEDLNRYNLY